VASHCDDFVILACIVLIQKQPCPERTVRCA